MVDDERQVQTPSTAGREDAPVAVAVATAADGIDASRGDTCRVEERYQGEVPGNSEDNGGNGDGDGGGGGERRGNGSGGNHVSF